MGLFLLVFLDKTMKIYLSTLQFYTNIGNFAPHCPQNLAFGEGRAALQVLQLKPSELLLTVAFLFSEHETQIIPSALLLN